jgi:hypothetical protein
VPSEVPSKNLLRFDVCTSHVHTGHLRSGYLRSRRSRSG